jgi:large subunit ribosomal protein L20
MTRSVNSVASRERRRRILKRTKGYFGRRKNVWTVAKNAYEKAKKYSYRDSRAKKRDFKSLWIQRISAAAKLNNTNYSKLMFNLKKNNVEINRKVLANMAMNNYEEFVSSIRKVM